MVTCDVDFAAPAAQEFLNKAMLTVAPCIGTDQIGPKRFGAEGQLAFSFGNAAQDEGAAMAEWANKRRAGRRPIVVTDNLLIYFKNVCKAFTDPLHADGRQDRLRRRASRSSTRRSATSSVA